MQTHALNHRPYGFFIKEEAVWVEVFCSLPPGYGGKHSLMMMEKNHKVQSKQWCAILVSYKEDYFRKAN